MKNHIFRLRDCLWMIIFALMLSPLSFDLNGMAHIALSANDETVVEIILGKSAYEWLPVIVAILVFYKVVSWVLTPDET